MSKSIVSNPVLAHGQEPSGSHVPLAVDSSGFQQIHVSSSFADPIFVNLGTGSVSVTASVGVVAQGAAGTASWLVTGTVHLDNPVLTVTSTLANPQNITGTVHANNTGFNSNITSSITLPISQTQMTAFDPDFDDPAIPVRPIFGNNSVGAFGNLIVAQETPIVALGFHYSINPWFVVTSSVNGGGFSQGNSQATLSSSTNTSGSATLESRMGVRYNPGQGVVARFTALFTTGAAGDCLQSIGLGDSTDGFFFAMSGSTFGVIRRQNGVDTFTSQSAWNGPDRYDGSGSSGITLDPSKGNVYQVRYQWLGYGAIKFFIEDPGTGRLDMVHIIEYSNANTIPSVFNPTLPLHARVLNRGNNSNIVLKTPSMGAYTDGAEPTQAAPGAAFRNSVAVANIELPLISIQSTGTFQGLTNRVRTKLTQIASVQDGGGGTAYAIRIRINPVLTSASFSAFDAATSTVSVDTSATAVSGGRPVHVCLLGGATVPEMVDLTTQHLILNPGDTATVTAQRILGAGTNNVISELDFEELFSG